jgi:hypothetical protein
MFAHQRRGRLGAKERPGQVDGQHPAPVLVGCFQQRREHRDPGIIDQRIEPAEAPAHRVHRGRDRAGVGDVARQRQRAFRVGQCCDCGLQQFALDVEQGDAPAFGQKSFCHRKPDAARGAGDQRNFLRGGDHRSGPSAINRFGVL